MKYLSHAFPNTPGPASLLFVADDVRHRETREPGADLSDLPEEAQASIHTVWTVDYIAAWQVIVDDQQATADVDELAARPGGVKAEATRRILAIMPEHKQRNANDERLEMILAHGADPANWPADKRAFMHALRQKWTAVKAIRARSDALEAMSPIPPDFRDDRHWPSRVLIGE